MTARWPTILVLVAINAVCLWAMYPPIGVWPLAYIAIAPLALASIMARRTRVLILVIALVHLPLWAWMQRWTAAVTQAGYVPFVIYNALWPLVFALIVRRMARHALLKYVPMTLVVPLVWVAIEFFRGALFMYGYPWFLLAYPLVEWPVQAQSADLLGVYFSSFLAATTSGLIVDAARQAHQKVRHEFPPRRFAITAAIVGAAHVINLAYGFWRYHQDDVFTDGPNVLAIQTNLPQHARNAWKFEMQQEDIPGFMDLTRKALDEAEAEVDLIAWPETMVPGVGFEPDAIRFVQQFGEQARYLYQWPIAVQRFQNEIGIPMLIGSPAWVGPQYRELDDGRVQLEDPKQRFNSTYLVRGDPPYTRYDKYFLTPFGETMPYISQWPWLEQQMLAVGAEGMRFNLAASETIEAMTFTYDDRTIGLGTPVCFESVMPRVTRAIVYRDGDKRADVLVNVSNDGWFLEHDGTRAQRAQIARFRCIENRVPLVRSVNTGASVHIDSRGNVAGRIGDGRYGQGNISGWLLAETRLDSRKTVYGRVGNLWAWLCLILGLGLTIATFKRVRSR